jgi:hypothetical protein
MLWQVHELYSAVHKRKWRSLSLSFFSKDKCIDSRPLSLSFFSKDKCIDRQEILEFLSQYIQKASKPQYQLLHAEKAKQAKVVHLQSIQTCKPRMKLFLYHTCYKIIKFYSQEDAKLLWHKLRCILKFKDNFILEVSILPVVTF